MKNLDLLSTREDWYAAFFAGDTEFMAEVEADSFCVVHANGVQSKWEQLHGISRAVEADLWFPDSAYKQDAQLSLHNHGDFSVVSGLSHTWIDDTEHSKVFFSELWRQNTQGWQLMHLHFTPATETTTAV
ncbi:ketosteroid isomerase-like protein [Rhodoferax ferrireducens]|uniref:Ketosteroid isomerase-like protein n=1 Tax=Rhodoferax ferrireducens TaxID=192843 RepID=A0ABU2C8J3_9BURK|nr:nuclear transport factor 2 family protein [Rhodoferax ferrireducens]MDR7377662.1 ketosteroid isomerase-like protein [Rhodoferax ferrireducens]